MAWYSVAMKWVGLGCAVGLLGMGCGQATWDVRGKPLPLLDGGLITPGPDPVTDAGSPEPTLHTVGGTVTGLLGKGLLLQNQTSEPLAVSADGAFKFPTKLKTGEGYKVTVKTLPQNPSQACEVAEGQGIIGQQDVLWVSVTCFLIDTDKDRVPDLADPFPNDPKRPVVARANRVYPHTFQTLYEMNATTYQVSPVAQFNGATFSGDMTDLAIDKYGVIYGITYDDLFVCDDLSATCYLLASLPQKFNGLTFLTQGTLHPYKETLVGISTTGDWYQIQVASGSATLTPIGGYGEGYSSSGDVFSIVGQGTFATVNKAPESEHMVEDYLFQVNPLDGSLAREVGKMSGYRYCYGLAGWTGFAFGFDNTGAILRVDLTTGASTLLSDTKIRWAGAAVATELKFDK